MTFAAAAAFCSTKTISQAIPCDDTRHFAETADHAIGLPHRHALGAGVDEGLEFRFETSFSGPSVIDEAFNREHLEHSIILWNTAARAKFDPQTSIYFWDHANQVSKSAPFTTSSGPQPGLTVSCITHSAIAAFDTRSGNGSRGGGVLQRAPAAAGGADLHADRGLDRIKGQQSTPMDRRFEGVRQGAVFVVEMGMGLQGSVNQAVAARCCHDVQQANACPAFTEQGRKAVPEITIECDAC